VVIMGQAHAPSVAIKGGAAGGQVRILAHVWSRLMPPIIPIVANLPPIVSSGYRFQVVVRTHPALRIASLPACLKPSPNPPVSFLFFPLF
jgi:hypothetical protein